MDVSMSSLGHANETEILSLLDVLASEINGLREKRGTWTLAEAADTIWLFLSVTELVTMHIGFAIREAGQVREINMVTTYAKSVLGMAQSVALSLLGTFNLAFPSATTYLLLMDTATVDHEVRKRLAFHMMAQTLTCSIVSGAMAERTSMAGSLVLNAFNSGVIYSVAVRCTWGGGWLADLDPPFYDAAGSAVVHLCAGAVAVVGALVIGARHRRWMPEHKGEFVPHSLPMTTTGVVLIWCGWYGYVFASQRIISDTEPIRNISVSAVSTTISAAVSGLTAALCSWIQSKGHSMDMIKVTNAVIGGLVAMLAGCNVISPASAIAVGVVAGILQQIESKVFDCLQIDDVSDACAVHGVCGAWGAMAVGFFHHENGLFLTGRADQLWSQFIGILFIAAWAAVASYVVLILLRRWRFLRVAKSVEIMGMDAMLGFDAYVRSAQQHTECSKALALLRQASYSADNVTSTLTSLKHIINRPFTPHAAEKKRLGEVSDILEHLRFDEGNLVQPYHVLVLHDDKDASEAAAVFGEIVNSLLPAREVPPTRSISKSNGFSMRRTRTSSTEKGVQLGRAKSDDVPARMQEIDKAQNVVVLLTKNVFGKPWCVFELVHAHAREKRLLCVQVEFEDNDNNPRSFHFPQDIDRFILQWQEQPFDDSSEYLKQKNKPVRTSDVEHSRSSADS